MKLNILFIGMILVVNTSLFPTLISDQLQAGGYTSSTFLSVFHRALERGDKKDAAEVLSLAHTLFPKNMRDQYISHIVDRILVYFERYPYQEFYLSTFLAQHPVQKYMKKNLHKINEEFPTLHDKARQKGCSPQTVAKLDALLVRPILDEEGAENLLISIPS